TARPGLHQFQDVLADVGAIFKEEEGEDGDNYQEDQVAGDSQELGAGLGKGGKQVGGPRAHFGLHPFQHLRFEGVDGLGGAWGLDPIGNDGRKLGGQLVGLVHDAGADLDPEEDDQPDEDQVG